jgi:hypothetical protein
MINSFPRYVPEKYRRVRLPCPVVAFTGNRALTIQRRAHQRFTQSRIASSEKNLNAKQSPHANHANITFPVYTRNRCFQEQSDALFELTLGQHFVLYWRLQATILSHESDRLFGLFQKLHISLTAPD